MNYIKWEIYLKRTSWQVLIVPEIFMLSKNRPGEKNPEEYTHGQQVINVFNTTAQGLCMSAF